jgi:flagellar protein FlaG
MAELDVKPVSSATGTFTTLRPPVSQDAADGNRSPDTGKILPTVENTAPDLNELAAKLNLASQSIGRDLRFEVDMESGQSVIQVLDRETGEIIRQIPPEKANIFLSGNGSVQLRLYDNRV